MSDDQITNTYVGKCHKCCDMSQAIVVSIQQQVWVSFSHTIRRIIRLSWLKGEGGQTALSLFSISCLRKRYWYSNYAHRAKLACLLFWGQIFTLLDHQKSLAALSILCSWRHREIKIKMYGFLFAASYCDVKEDVWISTGGDVARNCRDLDCGSIRSTGRPAKE